MCLGSRVTKDGQGLLVDKQTRFTTEPESQVDPEEVKIFFTLHSDRTSTW